MLLFCRFNFFSSPIILAHCELSEARDWWIEEVGGVAVGGSNRSDKSLPDPGEKGESRSMSIGEPELIFIDLIKRGLKFNTKHCKKLVGPTKIIEWRKYQVL